MRDMETYSPHESHPHWSKRQPSDQMQFNYSRTRSPEKLRTYLEQLEQNAGQWAVFSEHKTRNAARARIRQLRRSQSYGTSPLRWRTMRVDSGNVDSPVQILVCWDDENPDKVDDRIESDD